MINQRTPGHTLADLTDRLVDALTVAGTDGPTRRVLMEALKEASAGVQVSEALPIPESWEARDRHYREVTTALEGAMETLTSVLATHWRMLTKDERHKVAIAFRELSEVFHDVGRRACYEEEEACEAGADGEARASA